MQTEMWIGLNTFLEKNKNQGKRIDIESKRVEKTSL